MALWTVAIATRRSLGCICNPLRERGHTMDQSERMLDIVGRVEAVADAISTLDDLPGTFYVDIEIRMHHHAGDGYTNRDIIQATEKLREWLGLIARSRRADAYVMESPVLPFAEHTGTTMVRAYPYH